MADVATRTEPAVLASVKRRLFPDHEATDTYAVTDTQFARDEWLPDQPIPPAIRTELAPFNHVKLGSGYPDLVGVGHLTEDLLAVDRVGERPPLLAVEAKGYTESGHVDVETGIVQAYDRLHEANVAFVAAPTEAISKAARTLARECNVGILGVEPDGTAEPLELPRVVGNRSPDNAQAIRFQATAQGVAGKSFGLNHPKNYLAYPLAHYHTTDTETILADRVVGAVDSARTGAAFLDLITERPNRIELTPLGREIVRFALERHGSVDAALETFATWHRSRKRFCDLDPAWGSLARRVVWAYPATKLLVEELQTMHQDGITEPTLVDLVEWLSVLHPTFAVELFVRGTADVRSRVLEDDGQLRIEELDDGNIYHSPTVFQLKAMYFHAGILSTRGVEPNRLDPTTDVWQLREPL